MCNIMPEKVWRLIYEGGSLAAEFTFFRSLIIFFMVFRCFVGCDMKHAHAFCFRRETGESCEKDPLQDSSGWATHFLIKYTGLSYPLQWKRGPAFCECLLLFYLCHFALVRKGPVGSGVISCYFLLI